MKVRRWSPEAAGDQPTVQLQLGADDQVDLVLAVRRAHPRRRRTIVYLVGTIVSWAPERRRLGPRHCRRARPQCDEQQLRTPDALSLSGQIVTFSFPLAPPDARCRCRYEDGGDNGNSLPRVELLGHQARGAPSSAIARRTSRRGTQPAPAFQRMLLPRPRCTPSPPACRLRSAASARCAAPGSTGVPRCHRRRRP